MASNFPHKSQNRENQKRGEWQAREEENLGKQEKQIQTRSNRFLDMPLFQFPNLWQNWEERLADFMGGSRGLNIYEEKNNIIVEAPMPGLKPEDIEINFENGTLWIRGECKEETKERNYYRQSCKNFSFSTSLPDMVNPDQQPKATYNNGLLKVVFEKSKKKEKKKIPVKSS